MPVMSSESRLLLVTTLELWTGNARAGVKCSSDVPPTIIALIKAPSDKPAPPGGP